MFFGLKNLKSNLIYTNRIIMLKKILFITLTLSMSCEEKKPHDDFLQLTKAFVKDYANLFPDETPLSIDNLKLSELHIPSDSVLHNVDVFIEKYSIAYKNFEQKGVPPNAEKDFQKAKKILTIVENYAGKSKTGSQLYDVKIGFERIMKSNYANTDFRLQTLFNKLEHVKDYYEAAKKRLLKMSNTEIELAINQQTQTYIFFDETLPNFVNQNHQLTPQYVERLSEAKLAVQDYMAFIESLKMGKE
jgi:hypothetical protein